MSSGSGSRWDMSHRSGSWRNDSWRNDSWWNDSWWWGSHAWEPSASTPGWSSHQVAASVSGANWYASVAGPSVGYTDCSIAGRLEPGSSSSEDNLENLYEIDCTELRPQSKQFKLAKAFQIWRRQMLEQLRAMQYKKIFFEAWQNGTMQCVADMIWRHEDMDNILQTLASYTTHRQLWEQEREARHNRGHRCHGKAMPRMLPASYIHLFRTIISQTHAVKFRQHFW